jgi:hypothetical protein
MADHPKETQQATNTDQLIDESLLQVDNIPAVSRLFILDVVERMLRVITSHEDLPEHYKLHARFNARLIEAEIGKIPNEPNRSGVLNLIWAGLYIGMTSSPGLLPEDIERFHAQARLAMSRAGGKGSAIAREEKRRRWMPQATEVARAAYSRNPAASNETIATEISADSTVKTLGCPRHRALTNFVSQLRKCGYLPQRSGSLRNRSG